MFIVFISWHQTAEKQFERIFHRKHRFVRYVVNEIRLGLNAYGKIVLYV